MASFQPHDHDSRRLTIIGTPTQMRELSRSRLWRATELLGLYFTQYAKARMSYRADFFIAVGTSLTATALGFGFMLVLFTQVRELQGWSFDEVLFLFGFSYVPLGLFNVVSLNLYDFADIYIIQGKFDRILLRPIHTLFQVLFETFRIESLHEFLLGVGVVAYAAHRLRLQWSAGDIIWFALTAVSGAVIYLSVFLILTSVNFWFEDKIGIVPPVYNMIAFGRYPLSIYHPAIQFLLSWLIPFAFASFYPSVRFLGRTEYGFYPYLVPLVAAAFFSLALAIWNQGVLRYASTGS